MPGTCGAVGSLAKLLVEPGAGPHTFDINSEPYAFVYESMQTRRFTAGGRIIWGTRSEPSARRVKTSYVPVGRLHLQPGPLALDNWLPRILGGTKVGNNIDPAETLPSFGMLIHRDNGIFRYDDCVVGQAIFRGQSGPSEGGEQEVIDMVLLIYAKTETGPDDGSPPTWPGSVTALQEGAQHDPYIFGQGVLSLAGNSRPFDEFVLSIDNRIAPRMRNSLTPTCFLPLGRSVKLQTKNPFLTTTHTDAFNSWSTGIAGSLVFTSGAYSLTCTFPHLRNTYESPTVPGKTEIPLAMNFDCLSTQATGYEIRFTNDSTT